ncbi:MAG TPA: hypothetical protein VGK20_13810 [Candidatus Binatia bacterium]|jgi:hypothetical protein
MRFSKPAARAAQRIVLAAAVSAGSLLASCGTGGGLSSFLTPGKPTKAPPGNLVIYAAENHGNRIDAFRLGTDGLMPARPFSTMFVDSSPNRVTVANGVLYATLHDRVISATLGADGSLPAVPTSGSLTRTDYDPVELEVRDGVLYVAAAGIGLVQSFVIRADGTIPVDATSSGNGEFPADFSTIALDGGFLYSSSRETQFIDMFILRGDGTVPIKAQNQNPRDSVSLPDHMVIHHPFLYVTSASDKSVREYRLETSGFVPGDYESRTKNDQYYPNFLVEGPILYGAAYSVGELDLFHVNAGGTLPEELPYFRTTADPASFPSSLILHDGILYVAQAGLNRIDAYVLDSDGTPPLLPSSSTRETTSDSLPLSIALYQLP